MGELRLFATSARLRSGRAMIFFSARRFETIRLSVVLSVALLVVFERPVAFGQQGDSLADIARQNRAQKQQPPSNAGSAQQAIAELMEDQGDSDAPGGFKTYNAGDYKVWVPAPYHVQGHDDAGVVLSGPMVGSKHPIVLVGTPVVAKWGNSDDGFQDAANHFARLYAQSANCTKTKVADHEAFGCGMAAATLLGEHVSGNAVFVRAGGNVYPLFCVTPSDSRNRDVLNGKRVDYRTKEWATENLGREDDDMKAVWQKCETFFGSIHFKGAVTPQAEAAQSDNRATAKVLSGKPSGNAAAVASAEKAAPVAAEVAPPQSPAVLGQSTVPAGFKVHSFNYCLSTNQCWDASILVPADAKLVSSDCNQYVFEIKVQNEPFLLLAGSSRGEGCQNRKSDDANLVRWQQLVAPESARAPGTYNTISDQQLTLDGKRAVITKMRVRKGLTEWIGKRAEIESNGIPLVVGCLAQKEHFGDGEDLCGSVIESIRLP